MHFLRETKIDFLFNRDGTNWLSFLCPCPDEVTVIRQQRKSVIAFPFIVFFFSACDESMRPASRENPCCDIDKNSNRNKRHIDVLVF